MSIMNISMVLAPPSQFNESWGSDGFNVDKGQPIVVIVRNFLI